MSVQVRRRREAAAFLSTYVGAQGELLVDTTNNRVQVHDGATPGGFPAAKLSDLPSSASPLALLSGGTGASTAPAARSNLGAAASGANGDITSLSGLITPLTPAQGGTGTSASTGSGALVLANAPTLTTPNLGTPSVINLANGSNLPASGVTGLAPSATTDTTNASNIAAGTLALARLPSIPIASGGTGATTAATARTALAAAATGANTDITSLGALSAINGGPLGGLRNRVRNGNFGVNQRAVSGMVTLAAGAYGHDGVKGGASGATYTFATSGIDTALTITAGSIILPIEAGMIEGGTYTVSQANTAQARVWQGTGSSGSGAYAALPMSIAGVSAATQTNIEFSTGIVSRVQFEPGSVATPFERRHPQAELAFCQRYYQLCYPSLRFYNSVSPSTFEGTATYPVMRASPTATLVSAGTRSANITSVSINGALSSGARFTINTNGTGDTYALLDTWMLNAEI